MKNKMTKKQEIEHEEKYVVFLKTRIESKNFKSNVSEEEFEKTKQKYDKAKLRLRLLKM
jgi:hypothetical protein|nr:MAG TPA: hypothetical protein [Caudoviricetes sp.]